ncbi:MAG: hypothetical protein JNL05_10590 [Flavobacteriales bacterium]|nr:hypothetical protein [Flavobacteriales bacterium]
MDAVEKLREVLMSQIRAHVPVQTVYATVQEVQVEAGTCTCVRQGVEYFDVLLGLGQDLVVPAVGSKVLLGLVENKRPATFLIMAEAIEELRLNGNAYGGLVMVQGLQQKLNILEQQFNQLKQLVGSWVPVPNDGGASLKVQLATWSGQQLTPTSQVDLANPRVTHG